MAVGAATYAAAIADDLVTEVWTDEDVLAETFDEDPILGMSEKDETWSNSLFHHVIQHTGSQAVQRTFAASKTYKGYVEAESFQVPTREMYQSLSIEGKLMRAAMYAKNKGAARALLIDPVERNGEAAIDAMKCRFSKAVHGNGSGLIGRLTTTSNVATTTITLQDGNDLKNFPVGTPIQASATATGGSVLPGTGVVTAIGTYDNPTVTLAGNWSATFTGINAANAYLFLNGTYDNDFIYGFDAYNPDHTGTPGTFLTCNRNTNPEWFAGICMDGTKLSVLQRITQAARRLHDKGQKPRHYLMSTRGFEKLTYELGNKLVLTKAPAAPVGKVKLGIEYQAVEIAGPRGPIVVVASPWMPDTVERCGDIDTLLFGSIGPLIHWIKGSDLKTLRTEDAVDQYEARLVSDPAFLNKAPGKWVRVKVAA